MYFMAIYFLFDISFACDYVVWLLPFSLAVYLYSVVVVGIVVGVYMLLWPLSLNLGECMLYFCEHRVVYAVMCAQHTRND